RHRVDREDQVGCLNHHQHCQQRSGQTFAMLDHGERLTTVGFGHWHETPEDLEDPALCRIHVDIVFLENPETGEDQEQTEDVDDDVEAVQQGSTKENKRQPHYQRAENTPEENPVLILPGHHKEGEDQGKDKHVVDAE